MKQQQLTDVGLPVITSYHWIGGVVRIVPCSRKLLLNRNEYVEISCRVSVKLDLPVHNILEYLEV